MSFADIRNAKLEAAKAEVKAYSKQTLADVLGISLPTYTKLESDPVNAKLSQVQVHRLAKHLGVSEYELFLPGDSTESRVKLNRK